MEFISAGYMYKKMEGPPAWLKSKTVQDIYSVSSCISEDFYDWINEWKHNGFWFFNSSEEMQRIAEEKEISLDNHKLFFYKSSLVEYDPDESTWYEFEIEETFHTNIVSPTKSKLEGYDLVSFSGGQHCECSPLSCNHLAEDIKVNTHCLIDTYDEIELIIESGILKDCEPGPYRVFEVHSVISD